MATAARRSAARIALAVVTTLLIVGCAPTEPDGPASTTPEANVAPVEPAAPSTVVTDVPVRDADLSSLDVTAATPPSLLTVDALGIALPVDEVGVAADGQMEVPPLADRAGWYRFGAAPGAASGTVVIAAHVDSVASEGLGPFARLAEAQPGDVVAVDLTDGTRLEYEVTSTAKVPKTDVAWADVFDRDDAHRLVLITCGGAFRPDVRSYADNVIVTAVPVDA